MSVVDNIVELMIREGEIRAQQRKEEIAAEELKRQQKHRFLKGTLKALATFGPLFIPGIGPFGGLISGGVGGVLNHPASPLGQGSPTDILLDPRQSRF